MEQVNCWNNCNKMNRNLFDFVSWVSKNIIAAFVKFRLSNSGCQIKLKNVRERKPIIQRWFQYTKEIYDQSDHFCGESFEMTFKFNLIFKAVSFIIGSYIRLFYMWPWSNLNTHLLKGAELCNIFTNILGGYSVVLPLRSSVSKCLL